MNKETLKSALTGNKNATVKNGLRYLIEVSSSIENIDGKIHMAVDLMEFDKPVALGIAAWDNYENCNALVTHDLRSFKVWDLGALISKIRLD